jgi:hypothetical protein
LTLHARFLRLKIDPFSASSSRIQKGFSSWIRSPGGIVWWKNEGRKSRGTVPLKGQYLKIFNPCFFFINHSPQQKPNFLDILLCWKLPFWGKIMLLKIFLRICWSSPLIFTFSSNSKYVMFTYLFVFAILPFLRTWEPIIVFEKASAVS